MSNNSVATVGTPFVQFDQIIKAADQFAKSLIVPPAFRGKPADCFVALQWGTELGLQPMSAMQNIYVVNGRPTLSAQVMMGLLKVRDDYLGADVTSSATSAKCVIKRKLRSGTIETHVGEFTIEQAKVAGLVGKDNWKGYPQQMLEARATAFAARKAYPDVLAGIYTTEEVQDFDEPKNVTPAKPDAPPAPPSEPPRTQTPAAQEQPPKEVSGIVEDERLGKRRQVLIADAVALMQNPLITAQEREHAGEYLRGCKNPADIEDKTMKSKIIAYMDDWELQIEKRTFGSDGSGMTAGPAPAADYADVLF